MGKNSNYKKNKETDLIEGVNLLSLFIFILDIFKYFLNLIVGFFLFFLV